MTFIMRKKTQTLTKTYFLQKCTEATDQLMSKNQVLCLNLCFNIFGRSMHELTDFISYYMYNIYYITN